MAGKTLRKCTSLAPSQEGGAHCVRAQKIPYLRLGNQKHHTINVGPFAAGNNGAMRGLARAASARW